PEHAHVAAFLNNLGLAQWDLGAFAAAAAALERSLRIGELVRGPEHPEVAAAHNNLAQVLFGSGRTREARAHHERALAIMQTRKDTGPDDAYVAAALEVPGRVPVP